MRSSLLTTTIAFCGLILFSTPSNAQRMTQGGNSRSNQGGGFNPFSQGQGLAARESQKSGQHSSQPNPRSMERMPNQPNRTPTQPQRSIGDEIAKAAIVGGLGILEQELRRAATQPQNQNQYQNRMQREPSQNVYRPQPNYNNYPVNPRPQPSNNYPSNNYPSNNYIERQPYNPVVTVPSNSVPSNTYVQPEVSIPKNTLPVQKTVAPRNRAFNQIAKGGLSLTAGQSDEVVADLDNQIERDAQNFDKSHNAADNTLDNLRQQINDPNSPLTPEQKDAINQALNNKDPQELKAALEKAGAPPVVADLMAKSQQESNAKSALLDAINSGASSQEISQLAQAYTAAQVDSFNAALKVNGSGIDPAKAQKFVNQTAQDLNDLVAKQSAIETIQDLQSQGGNLSNGGFVNLPTGDVIATWLPQLPAGEFIAVDDQTVFVGTGGSGEIFSGAVSPADAGFPVVTGTVVETISDEAPITGEIVLHNPAENQASISYVLDRHVFTMEPKHSQRLPLKSWTIKFDRGGSFGSFEKVLQAGVYHFKTTPQGWDLVEVPSKVVIDNSSNPFDFSFVANQRVMVVKARSVLEISDPTPIDFRFDRGNGVTSRKSLGQGTYSVGVSSPSNLLDLVIASKSNEEEAFDGVDPRQTLISVLSQKPMKDIVSTESKSEMVEKPKLLVPPKRLAKVKVAKPALPQTSPDRPVPGTAPSLGNA